VNKDGKSIEAHNAIFIKRPQSDRLTSLSDICPICNKVHDDRLTWIALLFRASGRLTDSQLTRYIDDQLEFSHLCRNAWRINSAHVALEDRATNNSRKMCQLEKIRGKAEMADCEHVPKCIDTTKIELVELKELIVELREHRVDLKNTPAPMCPFEDYAERDDHFSQHKLILHLYNEHSPGPIPPLVKNELACKCPKCKAWLMTGRQIKNHMDKAGMGVKCETTHLNARLAGLVVDVRGMIGDTDRHP
jgi:hypothetical protein